MAVLDPSDVVAATVAEALAAPAAAGPGRGGRARAPLLRERFHALIRGKHPAVFRAAGRIRALSAVGIA
ncbi:MAG: hypothetical protein WKG07_35340 [Hymenobacter sp.]